MMEGLGGVGKAGRKENGNPGDMHKGKKLKYVGGERGREKKSFDSQVRELRVLVVSGNHQPAKTNLVGEEGVNYQ